MFDPVDNLPDVLADFFVALNERDFTLAASHFAEKVELIVDRDAEGVVRDQTRGGVEQCTRETMPLELASITPMTASTEGSFTSVELALTALRQGEAVTLIQQVDCRIENGLVVGVHAHVPRRRLGGPPAREV